MSGWRTKRPKGALRPRGLMNRVETDYAAHLKLQEHAGEVLWFAYEAIKVRLANNCFLTPDFLVMRSNGDLEIHEVKGRKGDSYYAEEDAKVKIKVCAALYPFRVLIVWPKQGGGWDSEELSAERAERKREVA